MLTLLRIAVAVAVLCSCSKEISDWSLGYHTFEQLLSALAKDRLSLAGLVTHRIGPQDLGSAYEGLLNKKEEYQVGYYNVISNGQWIAESW